MSVAKAYPVIWYRCPVCLYCNYTRHGCEVFNCASCGDQNDLNKLYEVYGWPPDLGNVNMLAVMFVCECGKENVVFVKSTITESDVGDFTRRIQGGMTPQFGLCEECFAGYDLELCLK